MNEFSSRTAVCPQLEALAADEQHADAAEALAALGGAGLESSSGDGGASDDCGAAADDDAGGSGGDGGSSENVEADQEGGDGSGSGDHGAGADEEMADAGDGAAAKAAAEAHAADAAAGGADAAAAAAGGAGAAAPEPAADVAAANSGDNKEAQQPAQPQNMRLPQRARKRPPPSTHGAGVSLEGDAKMHMIEANQRKCSCCSALKRGLRRPPVAQVRF